ncbi:MAG TPA: DUF1450 domain-containing protein [Paenibacillaceae bacterium]|nr:DUF1450 domain-containing protein [Paenibacillaceae bacterium]
MATIFRICDECKTTDIKTLVPRLKEIDPQATIEIGCQSYCGVGHKKHFAVVNDRYITGLSEDQLIDKICKFLNK